MKIIDLIFNVQVYFLFLFKINSEDLFFSFVFKK